MENLKIKYIPLGPFGPGKPGVPLPPPGGPVRIEKKIIHIFVTTFENDRIAFNYFHFIFCLGKSI